MSRRVLAVVPARGGSKGLPGKNIRALAGLPLIEHSIRLARMCPAVSFVAVSTDSSDIAATAAAIGVDAVIARPAELAQDTTPMWPVIRHALETVEREQGLCFDFVLLLDPTSPGRWPEDVAGALARLENSPSADGAVGASMPEFNPIWHCVIERDGWMTDLIESGGRFDRRQDVPHVYRINATLYIWRAEFVRREARSWRTFGRHLMYEVPEDRAVHIDTPEQFERTEALLRAGLLYLPWLAPAEAR